MITSFSNAAHAALLGWSIGSEARSALENAEYNASRNTWSCKMDADTETAMMLMLRANNTGPLYRDIP